MGELECDGGVGSGDGAGDAEVLGDEGGSLEGLRGGGGSVGEMESFEGRERY